jgi:hypothetical protein
LLILKANAHDGEIAGGWMVDAKKNERSRGSSVGSKERKKGWMTMGHKRFGRLQGELQFGPPLLLWIGPQIGLGVGASFWFGSPAKKN